MNEFFNWAFNYLMQDEGGFVNDKDDSGGPTKFGITQETYESYVGRKVSISEIENMTIDMAKKIYLVKYWMPLGCEKIMNLGVCTVLFNSGTLYGVFKATIFAQNALNKFGMKLKVDGVFGDKTIDALNSIDPTDFIDEYHMQIMARIDEVCEKNPKNEKYRKGWTKRADRLLALANASLSKTV